LQWARLYGTVDANLIPKSDLPPANLTYGVNLKESNPLIFSEYMLNIAIAGLIKGRNSGAAPSAPSSSSFVFSDRMYMSCNYISVLEYANWVQGEQLRSFLLDQPGCSDVQSSC
jgi:hypothetical protein